MMTKDQLQEEMAQAVDEVWKPSWHWERTSSGALSDVGWKQAYRDVQEKIDELQHRLDGLFKLRDECDRHEVLIT